MKYIVHYLRPYLWVMAFGLAIKIAGTVMDLILPYILAHLIDHVVPEGEIAWILMWGGIMILCALFGMIGNVIANRMASGVARDSCRAVRFALFQKIVTLSSAQVDEITIPSLESRLTSDTYHVHQMIGSMQRIGVRAPILLIGGIAVTVSFEPVLTLVVVAVLPFIAFIIYRVSRLGIPLFKKVQQASDEMICVVRENVQGIRVVKALSKMKSEIARFHGVKERLTESEEKAGITTASSGPLISLFLYIGQTSVILVGAIRVAEGQTETGKIIAFLSYFMLILNAMLAISRMFTMLSKGIASANRIAEIMDYPSDLAVIDEARMDDPAETQAVISFENVSFSYHKTLPNLSGISFTLMEGESLGIIGPTGSGKSTIIRLLMRFYDPDQGVIRIDGKDIRTIPNRDLREMMGVCQQNDTIFAISLRDNIDLWRGNEVQRIEAAADTAKADSFIREKEEGYDTLASVKGANLSGGQKQRLMIARAIVGEPRILILDDSSSALDYKTDAELRRALRRELPTNTSRIIVAQRVSSIMDCTEILVMDQGVIIGRGTHQELVHSCEMYREICESQLGGEIVE